MTDIKSIGTLKDPVRRRLYDFVAAKRRDVSRNEAAEGCGIQRTLAAFHLDKLVEAGLLDVTSRRLSGRTGPGAGRPAKLYRRATVEHTVSVPPRSYDLAAAVLAEALERAGADRELHATARRVGQRIGEASRGKSLRHVLRQQGYEPHQEGGATRLRNCPFHRVAAGYPLAVCGMNLALCEGLVDGLGIDDREARLDPRPGECCVAFFSKNKTY